MKIFKQWWFWVLIVALIFLAVKVMAAKKPAAAGKDTPDPGKPAPATAEQKAKDELAKLA